MSNDVVKKEKTKQVMTLLEQMKPQLALALPKHLNADRVCRIALTEFRKNPDLMACDATTFVASVMLASQLGLEVGPLGHAYLIPFNNSKMRDKECTFMLGYRGMLELARRSGHIASLTAHVVYSNDKFDYAFGLEDKLVHHPAIGERGQMIAAYAVAKLKDGSHQFEVMTKAEIDKIREKSKAGKFGPWVDFYDEMSKKTVIRRLFKYLPVSIEMQRAIAFDDKNEAQGADVVEMFKEISYENGMDIPEGVLDVPKVNADDRLNSLVSNKKSEPEKDIVTEFFEEVDDKDYANVS